MIKLRTATPLDARSLAKIYEYYVNNTTITFEYEAPDEAEFARRISTKLEGYPYLVAEEDGVPIGYAYASQFRERAAYAWSCELSIYINKNKRGFHIGEKLYGALEELLRAQNFTMLCAGITSPNEPSVAFHKKRGFSHIGTMDRIGFKFGGWHDVMWYVKEISSIDVPLPIIPFSSLDADFVNNILKKY